MEHKTEIEIVKPSKNGQYGRYVIKCSCGWTMTSCLPSMAQRYATNHAEGREDKRKTAEQLDAEMKAWL